MIWPLFNVSQKVKPAEGSPIMKNKWNHFAQIISFNITVLLVYRNRRLLKSQVVREFPFFFLGYEIMLIMEIFFYRPPLSAH